MPLEPRTAIQLSAQSIASSRSGPVGLIFFGAMRAWSPWSQSRSVASGNELESYSSSSGVPKPSRVPCRNGYPKNTRPTRCGSKLSDPSLDAMVEDIRPLVTGVFKSARTALEAPQPRQSERSAST